MQMKAQNVGKTIQMLYIENWLATQEAQYHCNIWSRHCSDEMQETRTRSRNRINRNKPRISNAKKTRERVKNC